MRTIRGLGDLVAILIQSALLLPNVATGSSLFSGAEEAVIGTAAVTEACLSALKGDIGCDSALLQRISFASHPDVLTTQDLTLLCTSQCEADLSTLHGSVSSSCGGQSFPLDGGNMTFAELVDYYRYKRGLVCLRDGTTDQFCVDVEASWNIQALEDSDAATWPNHTTKLYPRTSDPSWPDYVDENGTAVDPFVDSFYRYARPAGSIVPGGTDAFQDYLRDEDPTGEDLNYGWPEILEFDEFPLEVQCSSCFIDKFKYGLSSTWGDVFDEITVQVLANMEQNCGQTISLTPAHDLRGKGVGVTHKMEKVMLLNCPQYRTMDNETDENCFNVALSLNVPTQAIANLNDVNCADLSGETLCAPAPCENTRITELSRTIDWIEQYDNITMPQFFRWNPFVGTHMEKDEMVCVGPPGGLYTPNTVAPAQPTTYTTTATPTLPTQTGTVSNCGKYHSVVLGEDCNTIALNYSITFTDFRAMNPSIDETCSNLLWGFDYCVALVDGSTMPPVTTPTPVPAPGPTSPGATDTCYKWITTVSGDDCSQITSNNGITFDQFRSWNPYIDSTCSNLWADTAYCVDGGSSSGGDGTSTATPTTPATVAPPGPTNEGANGACARWHVVQSGDTCAAIASLYGITFAQFREWNPHVDSECTNIWPDYAYCVAVP